MAQTVVRVFDSLTAAEQARNILLCSGFPAACVHLDVCMDEAGPVEGNFILPDEDNGTGPREDGLIGLLGAEKHTDAYNNDKPIWRSVFWLFVNAEDGMQSARASVIMETFGAIDAERHPSGE